MMNEVIMKVHFHDPRIPFKLQLKKKNKKLLEPSETFKLKPRGQPQSKVNQRSGFN